MCDFSWGDMIRHLFTPYRWPTTDQRDSFAQVHHSELSLLGSLNRSVVVRWNLQKQDDPKAASLTAQDCRQFIKTASLEFAAQLISSSPSQSYLSPTAAPVETASERDLRNLITFRSFLSFVRFIFFLCIMYLIYFWVSWAPSSH